METTTARQSAPISGPRPSVTLDDDAALVPEQIVEAEDADQTPAEVEVEIADAPEAPTPVINTPEAMNEDALVADADVTPEVVQPELTADVAAVEPTPEVLEPIIEAPAVAEVATEEITPEVAAVEPETDPIAIDTPEVAENTTAEVEEPVIELSDVAPDVNVTIQTPVTPTFTIDENAPAVVASNDPAAPQPTGISTPEEPEILDAPIDVATQAPAPARPVASLGTVGDIALALQPSVDQGPSRSRAPAAIAATPVAASVGLNIVTQQPAPLPIVTERPAQEVAVFASQSSGSLLLTATALGADGVLRPSAVGSLAGIALAPPTPVAAPAAPVPEPVTTVPLAADAVGTIDLTSLAPAAPTVSTETINLTTLAPAPQPLVNPTVSEISVATAFQASDELLTTHVVRRGDSLTKMAIEYYGNRDAFVFIFEANRDVLDRPEEISVGLNLRVPVVPGLSN